MRTFRPEVLRRIMAEHGGSIHVTRDGLAYLASRKLQFSGNCSAPVLVSMTGRSEAVRGKFVEIPRSGVSYHLDMDVRCRQCENCLKKRAAHWRLRARAEYGASARSWLITLTVKPERRFLALAEARANCGWRKRPMGERPTADYDSMSEDAQFGQLHSVYGAEITRWLKRVRKNSAAEIRFLCVAEAHEDGHPHYHVLLHEMRKQQPVRKTVIQDAWTWGFSNAKLVTDAPGAVYATKYLMKNSRARVRASSMYGYQPSTISDDIELSKGNESGKSTAQKTETSLGTYANGAQRNE